MNITEEMEMPVRCDCGEWFDLTDGRPNHDYTKSICKYCFLREQEIQDLKNRIEDWSGITLEGNTEPEIKASLAKMKLELLKDIENEYNEFVLETTNIFN